MVNYKTLVIGASPNSDRYSHQVVVRLFEAGIEVVPMGIKEGKIGNIKIVPPFTLKRAFIPFHYTFLLKNKINTQIL
jgi:hypothetical protein